MANFRQVKRILLSSLTTFSTLLFFPGIAQAQLEIAPLVIEAEAKQGQATGVIKVRNISNEPFRARVYTAPFTYTEAGFQVLESSPQDLTPYLTFSPRELVVEPGQTRQIRIVSRLLPSTAAGEYRAVIFTENLQATPTASAGTTVAIVPRIGVTLYVRHGDVTPNIAVESARYDPQRQQIQLLVTNTGTATARPETQWTLSQGNTTLQTGKVDATTVVAGEQRYITINYPDANLGATAGNYQLTGQLSWGDDNNSGALPFTVNLDVLTASE